MLNVSSEKQVAFFFFLFKQQRVNNFNMAQTKSP